MLRATPSRQNFILLPRVVSIPIEWTTSRMTTMSSMISMKLTSTWMANMMMNFTKTIRMEYFVAVLPGKRVVNVVVANVLSSVAAKRGERTTWQTFLARHPMSVANGASAFADNVTRPPSSGPSVVAAAVVGAGCVAAFAVVFCSCCCSLPPLRVSGKMIPNQSLNLLTMITTPLTTTGSNLSPMRVFVRHPWILTTKTIATLVTRSSRT
mmetsp:Transcript_14750/g.28034  ORF Transcript_14750/g.28034 Transcript_14750/m.28034 type:complete len:210 (+) Transcript_14750:1197-1826(+)